MKSPRVRFNDLRATLIYSRIQQLPPPMPKCRWGKSVLPADQSFEIWAPTLWRCPGPRVQQPWARKKKVGPRLSRQRPTSFVSELLFHRRAQAHSPGPPAVGDLTARSSSAAHSAPCRSDRELVPSGHGCKRPCPLSPCSRPIRSDRRSSSGAFGTARGHPKAPTPWD